MANTLLCGQSASVRVRCPANGPTTIRVTASSGVTVRVSSFPRQTFRLSTDQNFVLLPVVGGTVCQVPYMPTT
jgi:hypothetical protein